MCVKQSLINTKSYSYCLLLICLFSFKLLSFHILFNCCLEWCLRLSCLNCSSTCFTITFSMLPKTFIIPGVTAAETSGCSSSSQRSLEADTSQHKSSDWLQKASLFVHFFIFSLNNTADKLS